MTAKIRNIKKTFAPTHKIVKKNILVSGCSFTYNNSEEHVCSWPYYLRDLVEAEEIYDCSQSGSGQNHIFNSVISELEVNTTLSPANTLIVIMLSGFTRTDVISTVDITLDWHDMSNFHFDETFSTLTLVNNSDGDSDLDKLCTLYKRQVTPDAQIYEGCLKVLALKCYLENKGYDYVITSWFDPIAELKRIKTPLGKKIIDVVNKIPYLGDFAHQTNQIDETLHPTPNCYLEWTKKHLVPHLECCGYVTPAQL